jgi:hypothetical protein
MPMWAYLHDREGSYGEGVEEAIDWALEQTREQFCDALALEMVLSLVTQKQIGSVVDLERWLFRWERQAFGDKQVLTPSDTSHLDAQVGPVDTAALACDRPNTLAFVRWFGAERSGTPVAIEFLRRANQSERDEREGDPDAAEWKVTEAFSQR